MDDPSAATATTQAGSVWSQGWRKNKEIFVLHALLLCLGLIEMFRGGAIFYDSIWFWGCTNHEGGWSGIKMRRCNGDNDSNSCGESTSGWESYSDTRILWLRIYSEATYKFLLGLSLMLIVRNNIREWTKSVGRSWIPITWPLLPLLVSFAISVFHIPNYNGVLQHVSGYLYNCIRLCINFLIREWGPRFCRIFDEAVEIQRKYAEIWKKSDEITEANEEIMRQYDDAQSINQGVLERIANRGRLRLPQALI